MHTSETALSYNIFSYKIKQNACYTITEDDDEIKMESPTQQLNDLSEACKIFFTEFVSKLKFNTNNIDTKAEQATEKYMHIMINLPEDADNSVKTIIDALITSIAEIESTSNSTPSICINLENKDTRL
jgi:hypothetical protein